MQHNARLAVVLVASERNKTRFYLLEERLVAVTLHCIYRVFLAESENAFVALRYLLLEIRAIIVPLYISCGIIVCAVLNI